VIGSTVAEIVVEPALTPCASPPVLIVATDGFAEAQVAVEVRFSV
jgi:hypothetical protein